MPAVSFSVPGQKKMRCYAFAPYPKNDADLKTPEDAALRRIVFSVKDNNPYVDLAGASHDAYLYVARRAHASALSLGADAVLVPVPGHKAALWHDVFPGHRIAEALLNENRCASVVNALRRNLTVKHSKSAKSLAGRPTVAEHRDSFDVDTSALDGIDQITLVDDTVTTGTQFIGARLALRAHGYRGKIVAFAVGHTLDSTASERRFHFESTIRWSVGEDHSDRDQL